MWQMVIVLFVIAAVLVYVVRHYVRVLRGKTSLCCSCAECGLAQPRTGGQCSGELLHRMDQEESGPDSQC